MKHIISILLVLIMTAGLCACSTDTYTMDSPYDTFKLKNVSGVTLSGPGNSEEGTKVELSLKDGTDCKQLMELLQGDKLDTCPTNAFGLCNMEFAFTFGDPVKIYPANDGSNYVCLYSINDRIAKYLELSDESMKKVTEIFEKYKIQVDYSK